MAGIALVGWVVLAAGCALKAKDDIPWGIQVAAPKHYDIWGVSMFLEKPGERSWRQPVGYVSCCWKEGERGPWGSGGGVDPFPELIFLHWFSFAEQKYYVKLIEVPPDLQDRMREPVLVKTQTGERLVPRHTLVFGLAPGGTVVVWIRNQFGNVIEVMRMQATEVPGDPDDFEAGTRNYLEKHGDYLREHGIPLEGW
ncbi:hypothetical protein ASQ50_09825 [Marinobacter sp. LQ44]|nr:hypothetical protein ASQ50_09825 [Marinobacter sp. LQ44]